MDASEYSEYVHKISNHPVHIFDSNYMMSPSALIPFCQFGTNMQLMGVMNGNFSVPLCNSFKSYVLNDQLCYQLDMNRFKSEFSAENLKLGVTFLVDINEDRQFSWDIDDNNKENQGEICILFLTSKSYSV